MFSSLAILELVFLSFIQNVRGASSGIIGFGLSIYQDPCCLACHDSLSSLYLGCTTFPKPHNMSGMNMGMKMDMDMDMDMMMMGTTSDECRSSNLPWLQTMAYCIQQGCSAHGYTAEKQAKCFSTHAVAGASKPTFDDSLPSTAPVAELPQNATWLNVTSLVNHDLYDATYGTLAEFARSEYMHTRYSMILYLIVIATCLFWGVKIQLTSILPVNVYRRIQNSTLASSLQRHVTLPALFGSRHLEPLPAKLGYVPGRALSISISIYVALNIIFSSISFRSFQPNIYWPSQRVELCEYVGNRTGMLSLVNISIAILFAGRNNLLIAITGWSQTTFLTLHRWAARVATLQAIVHSAVYTLQYTDPGYEGATPYSVEAAEPFYWWGIIGTIALSLAAAFAVLPLRMTVYELFLVVHIILIILALIACWYHLVPHFGFEYGYQVWLYICFAFWGADRLARLARIIYYNRLGDAKAIVEAIPGCNILQVTVFTRVIRGIGPGQHTFLYFPTLGKFWESHPFSIAAWETGRAPLGIVSSSLSTSKSNAVYATTKELGTVSPGTDSIHQVKSTATPRQEAVLHEPQKHGNVSFRLMIRAHSGMTAKLHKHLSSPATSSKTEVSVYTEGCYAGHNATLQSLYTADTVLCLAGGVGITHILGFVQEYARGTSREGETAGNTRGILKNTKRFILAWTAKEITFIDHVRKNYLANANGVECLFWYTGASERPIPKSEPSKTETQEIESYVPIKDRVVTVGRMNIASVMRSALEAGRQTTVLVCGPAQMADEARKQVVNCAKDGFCIDLIEEAFTW
ncbi:ferric reductase like transmembrane component-domain-containing protein [Xylaria sp. FL0043]|nr:ferric reductase like transmembrane component-domain-containing protein [Xylaria sp. FL0043]